jgi:acyl carrier protein
MTDVRASLQEVFRQVFDDPALVIQDDMDANAILEWDSLQHINLIVAAEKAFGVRMTTGEIARLKRPGENVGTFIALLTQKLAAKK